MSGPVTLELQPGSSVQMQPAGDPTAPRYSVQVIGQIPGVSVLVTAPIQQGRVMMVREGQIFVVRCITGEQALGFTSSVLRSNLQPYPYLHLSYPDQSHTVTLRGSKRVKVQLPAQVQRSGDGGGHWGTPTPASIRDISAGGMMLDSAHAPGAVGDRLRLSILFPIEHMVEQSVTTNGIIRVVYEDGSDGQRYRYGLEFIDLEPAQELALRVYVYERILMMGEETGS